MSNQNLEVQVAEYVPLNQITVNILAAHVFVVKGRPAPDGEWLGEV